MKNSMIKVEHITKEYRLGVIGQTTIRDELARLGARIAHKEDPTTRIGQTQMNQHGMFVALSDISFDVNAGEAIGIIGHNGAGKSTLLKLITRITLPTAGRIFLNGRVASMLEVGTGFHSELTGRENIYINGAVLGMTKKEIDQKIDRIIDFSECSQFIDTPVKRYSSGMNLKLGFSVAAHLDAEIVIMDEVLAVGDVAFQNKCIQKMKEISQSGRTILYVSHHMHTIQSLCNRCIVLNQGKLEYMGDVESSIQHYIAAHFSLNRSHELGTLRRPYYTSQLAHMEYIEILDRERNVYIMGEKLKFMLRWSANQNFEEMRMRIGIWSVNGVAVAISYSDIFSGQEGENVVKVCLDISQLLPGKYSLELILNEIDEKGVFVKHDALKDTISFEVIVSEGKLVYQAYNNSWGYFEISPASIL